MTSDISSSPLISIMAGLVLLSQQYSGTKSFLKANQELGVGDHSSLNLCMVSHFSPFTPNLDQFKANTTTSATKGGLFTTQSS